MGRAPCCDRANVKRGPWSPEEDTTLKNYVLKHGTGGNWIALPHKAGLRRCGKSCRLRWLNYLRPDIKHGGFTQEEDNIIWTLYKNIGSKWSLIASHLPGRTDNDVKNYWNTKLKKKLVPIITSKSNAGENSISINHINPMGYDSYSYSNHPVDYGSSSATQVATTTKDPLQRLSSPSSPSMDDESCMPMPTAWAAAAADSSGDFERVFDDFEHGSSFDFQETKMTQVAPNPNLPDFYIC